MRGAIAIIEEVGERPYEIDRYLTQLALTGELAQLAAVIVGDLTRCADANPPTGVPDPADAALADRARAAARGGNAGRGRCADRSRHSQRGGAVRRRRDPRSRCGTLEITEPAVD